MSETRRYILTLRKVPRPERNKFRALSRAETYREIKPGEVGERVAYSVEMTEAEYTRAIRDVEDPRSSLIAVEEDRAAPPPAEPVPDRDTLAYLAADGLRAMGLTGEGIVVGQVDTALGAALANGFLAGRIKAAKGVAGVDPLGAVNATHASKMVGLSVPSGASLVLGAFSDSDQDGGFDSEILSLAYWMIDEVGIDVLLLEVQGRDAATAYTDLLRHARSKGILEVMPAGNYSNSTPHYPAAASTFAVSNYDRKADAIKPSSSYGDYLFAASTGTYVNMYNPDGSVLIEDPDGGTSAASAMAAGIAGSLLHNPTRGDKRDPATVRDVLARTARRTGASPLYEGNGVLSAGAALNVLQVEKPECPQPTTTEAHTEFAFVLAEDGTHQWA